MRRLATFSKPEDAHLVRMQLADAGIEAYLENEISTQLVFLYNAVTLSVADADYAAARAVLDDPDRLNHQDEQTVHVACPRCMSHDTERDELPRKLGFLSLLILFIVALLPAISLPLWIRDRWKCASCKHTFRHR